MNKKVLGYIGVFAIVVAVFIGIFYLTLDKDDNKKDALSFKEKYEALNGTSNSSGTNKYVELNIPLDNKIKYIDVSKALEVLDSKEAIIYVGAPWCPWCRNAVPVLFEVNKIYDDKTIYYLELDDVKSIFEVKDGELVKTKDGTKDYYKLLDKLSDRLRNYTITKDGNIYDTHEKRIYMPYVIGVKDGKVVGDHIGSITLNEGQSAYDALTKEQHDELLGIYNKLYESVYGKKDGVCDMETCE